MPLYLPAVTYLRMSILVFTIFYMSKHYTAYLLLLFNVYNFTIVKSIEKYISI